MSAVSKLRRLVPAATGAARARGVATSCAVRARSITSKDLAALLKDDPDVVVVDVREPSEIQATKKVVADAINVPLGQVVAAFNSLDDADFASKFSGKRPAKDDTIVFACARGMRSRSACDAVESFGYTDVINFADGANGLSESLRR